MSLLAAAGFCGKLPARGDFVRAGLPRSFVAPWDEWLNASMAASHSALGEAWLDCYLQAPVWRFRLPIEACGPLAALGVMLPSVDKAGRYFPLSFAALTAAPMDPDSGADWLDACESAGRQALADDIGPEQIMAMIGTPNLMAGGTQPETALWWTEGNPRLAATRLAMPGLPPPERFAAMLGAELGETQQAEHTA